MGCVSGGIMTHHQLQRVWGTSRTVSCHSQLCFGTPKGPHSLQELPWHTTGFPAHRAQLPPRSLMTVIKSLIPCGASLFLWGARSPREQP